MLIVRIVLSGNSGDSLALHRGMPFSTKDQDNDNQGGRNCAIRFKGAWWYERCHHSNLNGLYHRGNHSSFADGVNWKHWKGYHYSLKRTEMKIRPVDFWTVMFMAQQRYSTNLTKETSVLIKSFQHVIVTLKLELSEMFSRFSCLIFFVRVFFQNRNSWFCRISQLNGDNNNNNNNNNNDLICVAVHAKSFLS